MYVCMYVLITEVEAPGRLPKFHARNHVSGIHACTVTACARLRV